MKQLILSAALFLAIGTAHAHEGHDNVPGAQTSKMSPPGQVKTTSRMFIEVREEKGTVKLLAFEHDKKDLKLSELNPPADLKIVGSVKFPKKSKAEEVKFLPSGNLFEAKIDAKNSYRYTLDLILTFSGKSEKVSFNIEPQQ